MTDLHTHILPGMDDGAPDAAASLALLRMEAAQGVDYVVLTPHFYRDRESAERFLARREQAMERLQRAIDALPEPERVALPDTALGAETAWVPGLASEPLLPRLALGKSRNLLLELPTAPWTRQMLRELCELPGRTGLTPVLAHLERYLPGQKPRLVEELLELGFPVQLSAAPLLRTLRRAPLLRLLRRGDAQLLASDTHNAASRPPDLAPALAVVRRRLGAETAEALDAAAARLAGRSKS